MSMDELRDREIAAAEAGNVDALMALRTDDFVAMPPGHPPVRGREDVRAFLTGMLGQMELEETLVSEEVVVSGDVAYDRGTFTGTATPKAGGEAMALDGKYVWIARRQDDGVWKYAVHMWSDNGGS